MIKEESTELYNIKNNMSFLLNSERDCVQIIQSNFGSVISRYYSCSRIESNGWSDIASFNIRLANDSIADRIARREAADLAGMNKDEADKFKYTIDDDQPDESGSHYDRYNISDLDRKLHYDIDKIKSQWFENEPGIGLEEPDPNDDGPSDDIEQYNC